MARRIWASLYKLAAVAVRLAPGDFRTVVGEQLRLQLLRHRGKADFMTRRITDGAFAIYLMNGLPEAKPLFAGSIVCRPRR